MTKTYEFERRYYVLEVPVTAVFCAAMLGLSLYNILMAKTTIPAVYGMFVIAAVYQLWNLLLSHAYPQYVHVDDESITFELWGRKDRYDFATLDSFLVRSNPVNGNTFIRAGKTTPFRGRYWIGTKKYTNGKELYDAIEAIELRTHPDSLKALARERAAATPSRKKGKNKRK